MPIPNFPTFQRTEETELRLLKLEGAANLLRGTLSTVEVRAPASKGSRLIMLGDSITGASAGATTWQTCGMNFASLLPCLLGKSVKMVRNAGVSGSKASDVLARLQTDVLNYKPDIVHLLVGTNDAGNAVSLSTYKSNMQSIADQIRGAGARLVVGTVLAREAAYRNLIAQYNNWIYDWAGREGIDIVDYYAYTVDYTTGGIKAGIASDSIHPNTGLQHRLLAEFAAAALLGKFGVSNMYMSQFATSADATTTADPNNLVRGGCFNLDTNADGVPDFWTAGGGGSQSTFSMSTDSAVIGRFTRQVRTALTGNGTFNSPLLSTGFSVGDVVAFSGMFRATGWDESATNQYFIRCNTQANTRMGIEGWSYNTTNFVPFHFEGKVPAGTTSLQCYVQLSGTANTGTLDLAQATITNLTTGELAQWS